MKKTVLVSKQGRSKYPPVPKRVTVEEARGKLERFRVATEAATAGTDINGFTAEPIFDHHGRPVVRLRNITRDQRRLR